MDVTIVIPTYNRRDALLETLNDLSRMNYPMGNWEAVVVDDGSTDDTELAVQQWKPASEIQIRYIKQNNAGPSAARNRGAFEARGKVLIFIDNDILVEPSFIEKHLQALADNRHCWILGRVIQTRELQSTPFGRYRDALHEKFHSAYPSGQLSKTDGITTQNVSIPAHDFQRLDGFDQRFKVASSEDWDLAMRASEIGIQVLYHPEIAVVHNDWADTLESFCEKQRKYSMSDVLFWQKHGDACPRAALITENAPVKWNKDSKRLIIKKLLKQALSMSPARGVLRRACLVAERWLPDSRLSHRFYKLMIGIAIFRGVRQGLAMYGSASSDANSQRAFVK